MSIGVMLFYPFTGTPRHPDDIKSDPDGILVWDGEAKLRTAKPAQPDCRTCKSYYTKDYMGNVKCCDHGDCTNGDKYVKAPALVLWRTE